MSDSGGAEYGAPGSALPTVSVVIATRNRPELLRSAVRAALAQRYKGRVEVIVVFDQSEPEGMLEVQQPDRSVVAIRNTRTPGLAGARNSGVDVSRGEFVAFCDDDDEWLPDKLDAQVRLAAQRGSDTVVTGIMIEYRDKRFVRIPRQEDMKLETLSRRRVMEAHMSTVLVRTEALRGPIGPVNEELPGSYGEDFDWILRAARHGEVAVISAPLVRIRWGQSQFARNWPTIVEAIDYGLAHDPQLTATRPGLARLKGRRAFALAAMGRTQEARRSSLESLRLNWRERRAYLAIAVSLHLVSAERLMHWAHSRGRGI